MLPLLQTLVDNGFVLEVAGIFGIGLIGLSGIKLAKNDRCWGGPMITMGAIGLLVAKILMLAVPYLTSMGLLADLGGNAGRFVRFLQPLLLTLGFGGIVWGIWAHQRWLRESED